jgi:hypothetical protein
MGLTTSGSTITGGLSIGSGLGGDTATLQLSGANILLDIAAVPEPSSLGLVLVALLIGGGATFFNCKSSGALFTVELRRAVQN